MIYHSPIMVEEVLELLEPGSGEIYVDGTIGGGGHALAMARHLGRDGRIVGIDRDREALEESAKQLSSVTPRVDLVYGDWRRIDEHLDSLGIEATHCLLLDLGVSSHQLDRPERGFSYRYEDAPLDMRMDAEAGVTAADILNDYSQEDLSRIIATYGEERWASRIAKFIVARRPMRVVRDLLDAVKAAVPSSARREGPHPARRTFQAIRMEVNREMEGFEEGLMKAISSLAVGGRMAVISFHSLEDRPVKRLFRYLSMDCRCPPDLPICACGGPVAEDLTPKPVTASARESEENPRSTSAKLRAIRITDNPTEAIMERRGGSQWR